MKNQGVKEIIKSKFDHEVIIAGYENLANIYFYENQKKKALDSLQNAFEKSVKLFGYNKETFEAI